MLKNTLFNEIEALTADHRTALESIPVIQAAMKGEADLHTYIAFLTEAYHHVKHTVPLLMACGAQLPERLEWLREGITHYIEEEIGHQEWILNDLAALGVDKEAVRNGTPSVATELMISYAYDTVYRNNPVGLFGMVYALEKTSSTIATYAASQIAETLELPEQAMSYMISHGSLDIEHMQYYEKAMNRLDDEGDKASVLHTAPIFYQLYSNMFRSLPFTQKTHQEAA